MYPHTCIPLCPHTWSEQRTKHITKKSVYLLIPSCASPPQKSPIYPQKSPIYPQKSPVYPQKSPIYPQKSRTYVSAHPGLEDLHVCLRPFHTRMCIALLFRAQIGENTHTHRQFLKCMYDNNIFTGHFPQKSPTIRGSFAERIL